MELELIRTYFPNGTNGALRQAQDDKNKIICYTIELPWKNNQHRVSCIPEGRYELKKRYTVARGQHLILVNVPDRQLILIHAANDAKKELQGCIAPVSILVAEGKGSQSRIALAKLNAIVFPELEKKKFNDRQGSVKSSQVYLTIKS